MMLEKGDLGTEGQRTPRSAGSVREAWRLLPREHKSIVLLGVLAIVAAQVESASLILIAAIAASAASSNGQLAFELASTSVSWDLGTAIGAAILAVIVAGLLVMSHGVLQARTFARTERIARNSVLAVLATRIGSISLHRDPATYMVSCGLPPPMEDCSRGLLHGSVRLRQS